LSKGAVEAASAVSGRSDSFAVRGVSASLPITA
jgi:hypothetical protein